MNSLAGQQIQTFVHSDDEYWDPVVGELDLSRTVLVDNNPQCHVTHPENGILVESFFGDPSDQHLPEVLDALMELLNATDDNGTPADVRKLLKTHNLSASTSSSVQ
eukprot:TRINITY_DN44567_c0_g1_i1.p3 TRINITY_DN44567_c0_g1~~TRINITY_DN44567_c0_g1_i1.p3  ORF type:complete len:106 (+),score=20.83 TRINITY_DN44567_c0_g1_i1:157-474(+)